MRRPEAILLMAVLATAPAFAAKPQIQWNMEYDHSAVSSYAWKESPIAATLAESNPFMHNHIINAIEYQLSNSGLTEVTSDPDVLVTYYGSIDSEIRLEDESYDYGWAGYGGVGWGRYGYGFAYDPVEPQSTNTRVVQFEQGTLIIDIIDADDSELIWRGSAAELEVSDDPEKNRQAITKAIEKMVKQSRKLRK